MSLLLLLLLLLLLRLAKSKLVAPWLLLTQSFLRNVPQLELLSLVSSDLRTFRLAPLRLPLLIFRESNDEFCRFGRFREVFFRLVAS